MNTCTAAAVSMCTSSAAVLNSCNAAATASRTRRTRADDRDYSYDHFYSLLEEGRRNPPRPALAADDVAAGDGCREAEPAGCCHGCKIAIRSFVVVASLLAAAFLASLVWRCESWSDAFPLLFYLVMLVTVGGNLWAATLDM